MQHAWKVGLFVVLFGVLFVVAYQLLGRNLFPPDTATYYAEFEDVGGLAKGSKVLMAGVRIGEVDHIELVEPRLARLTLKIDADTKIPSGSTAQIASGLIGIGDFPVQIMAPAETTGYLASGATIPGKRKGPLEGIVPDLTTTVEEINKTLVAVRSVIENRDLQKQLVAVLEQSKQTLAQFSSLAQNANSTLTENRSTLNATLKTFAVAMNDVQRSAKMAADLLADPTYRNQAKDILANLNATSRRADEMIASLQKLVDDPELRNSITATARNAQQMTESGTRIAVNAERMSTNGVEISENIAELSKKVNELADEARGVFDQIKRFFERTPSVNPLSKVETTFAVSREIDRGRFQTDFNARIPFGDGSIHIGMYDAFEENGLNLQLGRPFGRGGEYRYGVYGGKPGFGVDYPLSPNVSFRGDAFGLNDPRLDVRLQYRFRNDLLGWLGMNRVGDGNVATVGIGIKR